MKKISLLILSFLIITNSNALDKLNKLDMLDKQSKEFFNAITGLEKDYLEEQISKMNNNQGKKVNTFTKQESNPLLEDSNIIVKEELSEEDFEKNTFEHENEMARLTTDFTRSKKLKDIKIKSMYTFNGKNYVVLKLEKEDAQSSGKELSQNIEGRYKKGDFLLTHKIIAVNKRTKTVILYKKLDSEYGYSIYINNYGISVSDLQKKVKIKAKVEKELKKELKEVKTNKIMSLFKNKDCLYTVNVEKLNVRNTNDLDAEILRLLKRNDTFSIINKKDDWLHINTIYKDISGDTMIVKDESNWVQQSLSSKNITANKNNCF